MDYSIGTNITCYYHDRRLKGLIIDAGPNYIVVLLKTQYQGQNEFWDVGERKLLYKKLITHNSLKT